MRGVLTRSFVIFLLLFPHSRSNCRSFLKILLNTSNSNDLFVFVSRSRRIFWCCAINRDARWHCRATPLIEPDGTTGFFVLENSLRLAPSEARNTIAFTCRHCHTKKSRYRFHSIIQQVSISFILFSNFLNFFLGITSSESLKRNFLRDEIVRFKSFVSKQRKELKMHWIFFPTLSIAQ